VLSGLLVQVIAVVTHITPRKLSELTAIPGCDRGEPNTASRVRDPSLRHYKEDKSR